MTDRLTIALAQLDPTVGDVQGNARKVRRARAEVAGEADIVVYTELMLSGYPPEDLVLKPAFQDEVAETVKRLAAETADGGPALLLPTPWVEDGKLYNAVLLLDEGRIKSRRYKCDLPNYDVFDEKRVFEPGPMPGPINFRDVRLGVPICEDIWGAEVLECLTETGAEIVLVPNGSPFDVSKPDLRLNIAVARVKESGLGLAYVNQVGGQDELVFDGGSFVLNADCTLALQAPMFEEAVVLSHWHRDGEGYWVARPGLQTRPEEGLAAIYRAMVLGLRDYVDKNRFPGVLLGLSGGIDSALSAAVAVDALGPDRVHCVMLPSVFTSRESLDDAAECTRLLGTQLDEVSIAPAVAAFEAELAPLFEGRPRDVAEENIQPRARAIVLMALSNKLGHMLLTTGNKSEMSVGYATIYGDMAGGYSVLKDVYKTTVFALARWRNQRCPAGALGPEGRVVPENVLVKAPSAELAPDQKDEDSLPPYEILDDILECLVEREMGVEEITARGHAAEVVRRIEHLLYVAEYKRRQAPPGVKITEKAFGRDRRYPITNGFRDAR
ncbi:MAG: NAD+ synthase [Alphaproteobacteria bacterium]|nr:NAD+ synthase [Alphaproteobacteria bacterium]